MLRVPVQNRTVLLALQERTSSIKCFRDL